MFCIIAAVVILLLGVVYVITDSGLRSLKVGKITDKHVFITGCDTGFGHLAAIRLDKLGFQVFAGCLTEEGAASLSEKCSSRMTTVMVDVRSTTSIAQAAELVQRKLPPETGLWALINNAGVGGLFAPTEFCSREDVFASLDINLLGVVDVTRHFLPLLRKSRGRIVNTSSVGGRVAFLPIPYTISKYGVEGFSDKLRREVHNQGIKVSVVEPGAFQTSIFHIDNIVKGVQTAFDKAAPEVQDVYGGIGLVNKVREVMMYLKETGSPQLDQVVDAYTHAITSRFPRTRYAVGRDAMFYYIPISYLPDMIADLVLPR